MPKHRGRCWQLCITEYNEKQSVYEYSPATIFPAMPESEGAEAIQATSCAVIWDRNREPGRAMSTVAGPAYPTTIPKRTMYREDEKAAKYISLPLPLLASGGGFVGRRGLSSDFIYKARSSLLIGRVRFQHDESLFFA